VACGEVRAAEDSARAPGWRNGANESRINNGIIEEKIRIHATLVAPPEPGRVSGVTSKAQLNFIYQVNFI